MEDAQEGRLGRKVPSAGRPKGIKISYKTISMRLPEEYVDKLHIAAEKSGLSINGFMKEAIDSELERISENNA